MFFWTYDLFSFDSYVADLSSSERSVVFLFEFQRFQMYYLVMECRNIDVHCEFWWEKESFLFNF